MRIYVCTDIHGSARAIDRIREQVKRLKPSLLCCLGDLSIFEHDLDRLLFEMNSFNLPTLMLHGNHESEERLRAACAQLPMIRFIHKEAVTIDGWTFAAFGGGGFDERYPELERLRKGWKGLDWSRTVFLSHAPPFGTTLDDVGEGGEEWHVGSKTLRKLIDEEQPLIVVAGHIHECFLATDSAGATRIENPGPGGRLYDLDALFRERKGTEDAKRGV